MGRNNKKHKTSEKNTENGTRSSEVSVDTEDDPYTYSDSISNISSLSELDYDIIDYSSADPENVAVVLEQGKFLCISEELMCAFTHSKVMMSGDLALSFCGFLSLEKTLALMPKKLKKTFNSLVAASEEKGISKDDIYIFYTERIGNIPLEMVLEMYKKIVFDGFKYIIFVSRVYQCNKAEVKDILEDFGEYSAQDLSCMPTRGEEVLLLSSHISKKQIVVNGNNFRLFLLRNEMFASFISLFEREMVGKSCG